MQCRGTGEIHTECGLAHGRSACHDDHLAGLQALRHVGDVAEARRHASGHFAALQTVELVRELPGAGKEPAPGFCACRREITELYRGSGTCM